MTMRITIKNEDTHRTATIDVVDFNPPNEQVAQTIEVPPGETRDAWIHNGRKVVVREKGEG